MDKRSLAKFERKIIFNYWGNTGLTASSNLVLQNLNYFRAQESQNIRTHLLNGLRIEFYSSINKLLILDE